MALAYLGLNLVFIYATPLEKMKNVVAVGSLAAANLFGPQIGGAFSMLMAPPTPRAAQPAMGGDHVVQKAAPPPNG